MPKRIRIQTFPNSEIRDYHLTAQIASRHFFGSLAGRSHPYGFEPTESNPDRTDYVADCDKPLVDELYGIDAVKEVSFDTRTVRITKEYAYNWNELEDDVIDTICAQVDWALEEVTVERDHSTLRKSELQERIDASFDI